MQTRKVERYFAKRAREERIRQAAIGAELLLRQIEALREAGAIGAVPAAAGSGAHALDPLDQVLDLDEALVALHNVADAAVDPAPLHTEIERQATRVLRSRCVMKFSVRRLLHIFITLLLTHYASFPIHAAPRETSLFDVAASHLSLAGTVTGFMSLPSSGILVNCAAGVKAAGSAVRNYNARTGRFPETNENRMRRELNYLEYDPVLGAPLSAVRLAGHGAGVALDLLTGTPVTLDGVVAPIFTATLADVSTKVGTKLGMPESAALEKVHKAVKK